MAASRVRHAADHSADELVRMLAQIAPVGIVQTDAEGQCVFVNDRWCALTGTTVSQALGAGWSDALHPGDVERVTEERLGEQNTRLLELDEQRKQFLAMASHELSTPLTSIISFCELIKDGDSELSAQTAESVGVIERNASRLLRVVGDLLLI